jgi:hypothetical protein
MLHALEIPFTTATLIDSILKGRESAIRKYRQGLKDKLDRGIQVSVGRRGTIRLSAIPVIDCTAVVGRWRTEEAEHLENAYIRAGLGRLVKSSNYQSALKLAAERLRAAGIQHDANAPRRISQCIAELMEADTPVQFVALAMSEILQRVDQRLPEMQRLSGRVIRNEGERTLITVSNGGLEELRTADSAYLQAMGVLGPGSCFSVHQFEWSPDSTMSLYIPAVDLTEKAADQSKLEQRLKDAERRLPEPDMALEN